MPTLKEIAKIANVSEAAVSMALRGKKGVSKETTQKIQEIADKLNYRPNLLAQGLARGETKSIGMVVPDIVNPYYSSLVQCMLNDLLQLGYHMVLGVSNENPILEQQVIDNFVASKVAGIIVSPINTVNNQTEYLERYYQSGIPMVFVSTYYPNSTIPYVMVDLEDGAYQLVSHLLQSGYRRIFYLTGNHQLLPYSKRIEGYKRAFRDFSIPYSADSFVECNYVTFEGAYNAVSSLLTHAQDMDAILTCNDIMALGVLRALQEHHISVPEDVAVAGFDNTLFSKIGSLPLTTVSQDISRMCQATINLLLMQLNGSHGDVKSVPLIASELIVRKTTSIKLPSDKASD